MNKKIPIYEVTIQVATLRNDFVDLRVLTTERPEAVYDDWGKDYEPIGFLTAQSGEKESHE